MEGEGLKDESLGSFKVLEDVSLKATYNMVIDGREIEAGEVIATFDKIQISNFNEIKNVVAARGGYGNGAHVFWETTREVRFSFSQGVFSKLQFSLLNNAKLLTIKEDEPVLITTTEELETNENGQFYPSKEVYDELFVYNKETGEKYHWYHFNDYYLVENLKYTNIIISYRYAYNNGGTVAKIGEQLLNGFLELEGKTRVKDDTSGLITTGIIKIPKLKLMSGLSMRLGTQANPVVGTFEAVGVPIEMRHNSYVVEFYFLNNDIDSDM